jgi:nucleoside-diphosphate-sugar epimerase
MKPRILILGSTGRTGKWLLDEALKRGYFVNLLVRDKSKISPNGRLCIFEGDSSNKNDLTKALEGCESVLSALNISRNSDFPWAKLRTSEFFLSQTMQNLIEIGALGKLKKVIFTSAWGVNETKKDIPWWFRWLINNSNIGIAYQDHERQEKLLENTLSLNYVAVRPVGLTNSLETQKVRVTLENNTPIPNLTISRLTTAKFMLDCLEQNLYNRQKPIISAE